MIVSVSYCRHPLGSILQSDFLCSKLADIKNKNGLEHAFHVPYGNGYFSEWMR